MDNENQELKIETSPEVFDALEVFVSAYAPATLATYTRNFTTKEIVAAIKGVNSDYIVKDTDVVNFLKKRGFEYQILPEPFNCQFQWLFAVRG